MQHSFKDNSFLMKLFTLIITLFSGFLIFGQTTVCSIVDQESQVGISKSSIYFINLNLTLVANENGVVEIDSNIETKAPSTFPKGEELSLGCNI